MKNLFTTGDIKTFHKTVSTEDIAAFDSGVVHNVYATFSIARDAEWSGRLFVLEMKEDDEEGIGTFIHVNHKSPAHIGDVIDYTATFEEITESKEIITSFVATTKGRVVAHGRQGQKILKKERLEQLMKSIA